MKDITIISKHCKIAYDFLINNNLLEVPDGRIDLGNGCYISFSTYETKSRDQAIYESHKKYIDIQYLIDGEELISVLSITKLKVISLYDEKKDIVFYKTDKKGKDYIIKKGEFLIFTPEDGHMPGIAIDINKIVRKAVIKVPINCWRG